MRIIKKVIADSEKTNCALKDSILCSVYDAAITSKYAISRPRSFAIKMKTYRNANTSTGDLTERNNRNEDIWKSNEEICRACGSRGEKKEGREKEKQGEQADSKNIPIILFRDIAAYSYSPCKNCIELAQRSEGAPDFPNRRFVSKIFKIHFRRTVCASTVRFGDWAKRKSVKRSMVDQWTQHFRNLEQ